MLLELLRSMVIARPYFIPVINGSGWTKCFGISCFFSLFFGGGEGVEHHVYGLKTMGFIHFLIVMFVMGDLYRKL